MARNKPDDPFTDDDWGGPGESSSVQSDEMPQSRVDPDRLPWLKPSHLNNREGTLELVSASGASRYSDVTLHVKVGPRHFAIGLRDFDPSYDRLLRKFGHKKADWHGTLRYKIMPHNGRPDGFVAVRPA